MFDFDAGKLLIIGIVALVFIPSKDLPRVLRQIGQFVGKMRRMASEFQGQFMDAMREADMAELRREAEALSKAADVSVAFDPIHDIKTHVGGALEGKAALDSTEAETLGAASEAGAEPHAIAPPDLATHGEAEASYADLSDPAIIVAERPHEPEPAPTALGLTHQDHAHAPLPTPPSLPASGAASDPAGDPEPVTEHASDHPGALETMPRRA